MIENKIAQSGLVNLDLEQFYTPGKRMVIDLKYWLWQEQILREKEFRGHVKDHDWEQYRNAFVAVFNTADAIIPVWAYMLIASNLTGVAAAVYNGTPEELEKALFQESLKNIDPEAFRDKKVLVKGCSNLPVPAAAYLEITKLLQPVVSSLMYGEACSSVPVYKNTNKPV